MKNTILAFANILILFAGGCGSHVMSNAETQIETQTADNKDIVESGDLVTAHYTMKMEGGLVFYTTDEKLSKDHATLKTGWFKAPAAYGPEDILAGNDKTRQELAQGVIGMAVGSRKSITLPPEKGFGPHDAKMVVQFPRIKTIPKLAQVQPADYMAKFGIFPVRGEEVNHVPYFKSKIQRVEKHYVVLEAMAEDGQRFESIYGTTIITLDKDNVLLDLEPLIGAPFELKGRKGVIAKKDDTTFSVDFNHPAAGKPIVLDIDVVSVTKAEQFQANHLVWIEDHDQGYKTAVKQDKPMVLVLYADWCSWCEKLLTQTVNDPRVQKHWDEFVWVKVNSDKQKEYKEYYEQDGFPMIVMTNSKGELVNKVNGFRDPRGFLQELQKCQDAEKKGGNPA
jgi:FKBP-type peptidyl-prolyl cis-trans isomerase 2